MLGKTRVYPIFLKGNIFSETFSKNHPPVQSLASCPWNKLLCEIWACNECIVCGVNIVGIVSMSWFITGLYLIEHVNFVQLPHFQHALHFNHQHNRIVSLDNLEIYMNVLHDVHAWSSGMGRQLYWICFKMDGIQHLLYCVVLKFNCSRFDSVLNI